MIFTNTRSYISTVSPSPPNVPSTGNARIMAFTRSRKLPKSTTEGHTPTNVEVKISKSYVDRVEETVKQKRILWGEPFWNFFHVLAEKVKESEFPKIRKELLNIIYTICTNLPCPDCTQHAVQYLNGINFNHIQTRDQLKDMLYHFHNAVNARKGYPLFPREELDARYTKAIFIPNVERFLYFFQLRHHSVRLMADDLHRQRLAKQISEWIKNHITCF